MTAQTDNSGGQHPVSHPVNAAKIPASGLDVTLKPDADQRAALAAMNELSAIDDYVADVHIARWQRDGVRITGRIRAAITQPCSITLEPVAQKIDAGFDALFLPQGSDLATADHKGVDGEIIIDPDGPDAPEEFAYPWLDVGAAVAEFFTMEIDPYPRAPHAESAPEMQGTAGNGDTEDRPNPFAKLSALKENL